MFTIRTAEIRSLGKNERLIGLLHRRYFFPFSAFFDISTSFL